MTRLEKRPAMPDRVLFKWPGAAIMGDDRPRYASVEPELIGSPVWGKGGAIAALLARMEAAEARVAEAERLLRRLRNEVNGCVLKLEPWSIREVIGNTNFAALEQKVAAADAFLAGAPAAPPPPSLNVEERKLAVTERLAEMGFHVPDDETLDGLLDALAAPPSLPPEVQAVVEEHQVWAEYVGTALHCALIGDPTAAYQVLDNGGIVFASRDGRDAAHPLESPALAALRASRAGKGEQSDG